MLSGERIQKPVEAPSNKPNYDKLRNSQKQYVQVKEGAITKETQYKEGANRGTNPQATQVSICATKIIYVRLKVFIVLNHCFHISDFDKVSKW